jgi:aminoglycoside phosphotransferase (APT) family kinase protein
VPDVRAQPFRQQVEVMVEHEADVLPIAERRVLDDLVDGLAARFAALADCGVPDTLVHGDFHPGNVRSDGTSRVLIDWGDSIIAHPALDMIRLRDWEPGGPTPALTGVWCEFWRQAVPGSDPERAVELIAPLAGLRDAVSYRGILSSIEPAERRYHDEDVAIGLRAAVECYRTSSHA